MQKMERNGMNSITSDQWTAFEETLERAEAYAVLNMQDEAVEELRTISADLQNTLPYLLIAVRVCVHFALWENAAALCFHLLDEWPYDENALDLAAACAQALEDEGQGDVLARLAAM